MAARSFRPDSATIRAAAAVFSQRVTVTFGSCFKNSEHCSSACPCETISRMSDSFAPGSASRLWSTRRRTLRTMEKLCFCMRSYTALTEPAVLFSSGRTPYWHSPCSMAAKTLSNVAQKNTLGCWNSLSQACWEYAPSTPWQATAAEVGNSCGVVTTARFKISGSVLLLPSSERW